MSGTKMAAAPKAKFSRASVDVDSHGARLQVEGAKSFVKSWEERMIVIATKGAAPSKAG